MSKNRKFLLTTVFIGALLYVALVSGGRGCEATPPPSVLLFVMDTTRLDAVSAYAHVKSTTPETDRLAQKGLRYTRAYATAPWTLPSHTSLFTGLSADEHGVTWDNLQLAEGIPTLAEHFQRAGYETVGFTENLLVGPLSGLDRGFDEFTVTAVKVIDRWFDEETSRLENLLTDWIEYRRDRTRPFFLFINVMDAHRPLSIHEDHLPPGLSLDAVEAIPQDYERHTCRAATFAAELVTLRHLYHQAVSQADERLAWVRRQLQQAGMGEPLLTVVLADHGELFGESNLAGHLFSLHDNLLRVPLVVHGLADTEPAVIDAPVSLSTVGPSLLNWATGSGPNGQAVLPTTTAAGNPSDVVVAAFDDLRNPRGLFVKIAASRTYCTSQDKVHGEMRTAIRFPWKLVWYSEYPPELYNLADDPDERIDLSCRHKARIDELARHLPEDKRALELSCH